MSPAMVNGFRIIKTIQINRGGVWFPKDVIQAALAQGAIHPDDLKRAQEFVGESE